jgi:predicted phosphate transport protein (TIGR00153 family)
MGFRSWFKKRPNKFLIMLTEQTSLTMQGLEQLKEYIEKQTHGTAKQIAETEQKADEARRILIEELMHTFVTPIDREDIFALSRAIDDVLDYAYTTVDEMEILNVSSTSFMERMASLLYEATSELYMSVERLQDNHLTVANEHAQKAKALENRVETVYREALADLFHGPKNNKHVVNMLKTREIYRHLSNAADRQDLAANIIADIIMKAS